MAELLPCPNPSCTNWNPAGRTKCFKCGTMLDRKKVESEDPGAHGGRRALIIIIVVAALLAGSVYFGRWRTIQLDTANPVVTITDPIGLQERLLLRSSSDTATIRGKVTDDHPLEVLVDGKSFGITDGEFAATLSVTDEPREVIVVAKDKKGNQSSPLVLNVERDATAPVLVSLDPPDGGFSVVSPVKVTGEADERLASVVVGNTPGAVMGTDGNEFEATVSLVGGVNELVVKIADLAGNQTSRPLKISYEARQLPEGVTAQDGGFVASKDGARLLLVPAGEFVMGSDRGDADERPAHSVSISAFLIDETPVTNAQWKQYADETGAGMPPPPDWDRDYATSQPESPVVNVSFEEAQAYARWAGRRLPSEAEWERAARGSDGRAYPWGNDPPGGATGFANVDGAEDGFAATSPVRSFEAGASPYGALDMAGNVWQWTYDWYSAGYYGSLPPGAKDPEGPKEGTEVVLRGGAFTSKPTDVRSTNRYARAPGDRARNVGFRCAVDLP